MKYLNGIKQNKGNDSEAAIDMSVFERVPHVVKTAAGNKRLVDLTVGDEIDSIDKKAKKAKKNSVNAVELINVAPFYFLVNDTLPLHPHQSVVLDDETVVHAFKLRKGQSLVNESGDSVPIVSIKRVRSRYPFVKMSVGGDHTYFLNGFLMHNADRYWVGGTANWDGTAGTKWAATSGGAGGSSLPTTSDNVYFDANSGASTVTVSSGNTGCADLIFTGFTGTFAGSSSLTCAGSLTLAAGMTRTYSGTFTMTKASGTAVITSNTKAWGGTIVFNGAGTFQLADQFETSGSMTLTAGTFDANSQTVLLSGVGTTNTITGAFTFYNLTKGGSSGGDVRFSANVTVSNTFSITQTSRVVIRSTVKGTARTLTVATNSLQYADFQDITAAGAASWDLSAITGLSGDRGGNSGITFTTAITCYWVSGTGNWNDSTKWKTTSGGGTGARVPLPQDTARFDSASFTAGSQTITANQSWLCKDIDFTGVTNTPTFAMSTTTSIFGSLTLVSGMSVSGTSTYTFEGRGSHTIACGTLTLDKPITIDAPGGTYTCSDAFTLGTSRTLTFTQGTFDANDQTIIVGAVTIDSSSGSRTVSFGTGTWYLRNTGTVWTNTGGQGSNTLNFETSTVDLDTNTASARTISSTTSATAFNILKVSAGTGTISLSNVKAKDINFTGQTGQLQAGLFYFSGSLTFSSGMSVLATATQFEYNGTDSSGLITSNGITIDRPLTINGVGGTCTLADALTLGSTRALTLTAGTFDINSKAFSVGTVSASGSTTRAFANTGAGGSFTVTGSGTTVWTTSTSTNFSHSNMPDINFNYSGGTGTRIITGASTLAASMDFDITAGTDTVTLTAGVGDLDFTGFAGTLNVGTRTIYGSLVLASGMTLSTGSNTTTFGATSSKTIDTNGKTLDFPLTFDGVGGTWVLQEALVMGTTRALTLTNGSLDFNGFNVTAGTFSSSNSNTRALTNSGAACEFNISNNNTTVWSVATATNLTIASTITVDFDYSGSSGIRYYTHGTTGGASTNVPNIKVSGGTDIFYPSSGGHVGDMNTTGFTGQLQTTNLTIYGNVTLDAGSYMNNNGFTWTFSPTSGIKLFTSNSVAFYGNITINASVGATVKLGSALVCDASGSGTFILTQGIFDTDGYTTTVRSMQTSGTLTREMYWRASTVNWLSGVSAFIASGSTNLTFDSGTSTLNVGTGGTAAILKCFTYNSGTIAQFNNVTYTTPSNAPNSSRFFGGAMLINGNFTITGNYSGANPAVDYAYCAVANIGTTITINGALTINGHSAQFPIIIHSIRSDTYDGNYHMVANGTVTLNNAQFYHFKAGGTAAWTGTNLSDGGGNTGITFDTPRTLYWIGNGGNWQDNSHWSLSSGGASATTYPRLQDLCIFDANSFSSGSQVVEMNVHFIPSIRMTGVTNSPQLKFDSGVGGGMDLYSFPCFVGAEYTFGNGMTINDTNFGTDSIYISEPPTVAKETVLTFNGENFPGGSYWEVNNDGGYDSDAHFGTLRFAGNYTHADKPYIGMYDAVNIDIPTSIRVEVNGIDFGGNNDRDFTHNLDGELVFVGNDPDFLDYGGNSSEWTGSGRFIVDTDLVTGGNVALQFYSTVGLSAPGNYIEPTIYIEGLSIIDVIFEGNYNTFKQLEKKSGENEAVLKFDATGSNPIIETLIYNGNVGDLAVITTDTASNNAQFSIVNNTPVNYLDISWIDFDSATAGFSLTASQSNDGGNNFNISFINGLLVSLAETITLGETQLRSYGKVFEETVVLDEVFAKVLSSFRNFTETIGINEIFVKLFSKGFLESLSLTDTFSRFKKPRGFLIGRKKDTGTKVGVKI